MIKTKQMCRGCRDDYYNNRDSLGNPGSAGCWNFKIAKIVERTRIGIWQDPPYEWQPEKVLNCYNSDGGVMIDQNDPRRAK